MYNRMWNKCIAKTGRNDKRSIPAIDWCIMTNNVAIITAPSAECKLNVDVRDRQRDRYPGGQRHRFKLPFHYVRQPRQELNKLENILLIHKTRHECSAIAYTRQHSSAISITISVVANISVPLCVLLQTA